MNDFSVEAYDDEENLFVALGRPGDNFYVRYKGDVEFIVDAGQRNDTTPFEDFFQNEKVDFCVCTHNHEDHAKGIIPLVEQSLVDCVWLPARWAWRAQDLLENPEDFIEELADNFTDPNLLARYLGTVLAERPRLLGRVLNGQEMEGAPELLESAIADLNPESVPDFDRVAEEASQAISEIEESVRSQVREILIEIGVRGLPLETRTRIHQAVLFGSDRKLAQSAINSALRDAGRIREILEKAEESDCVDIRWFRFNPARSEQLCSSPLKPVNAVEIPERVGREWIEGLEYLTRCRMNREALVFAVPEWDGAAPLLFTSDSRFGFYQQIPVADQMIVTAPHHGSENNRGAYEWITSAHERESVDPQRTWWVRSHNGHVNLGSYYCNLLDVRKRCVKCDNNEDERQLLTLVFRGEAGCWECVEGDRECRCAV